MRTKEEFKAEVMKRSTARIKRRRRLTVACVPLAVCVIAGVYLFQPFQPSADNNAAAPYSESLGSISENCAGPPPSESPEVEPNDGLPQYSIGSAQGITEDEAIAAADSLITQEGLSLISVEEQEETWIISYINNDGAVLMIEVNKYDGSACIVQ